MDKLITVGAYDLPMEAQADKLLLQQSGIRAFLADENLVTTNWFLAAAVGGAKLQVAEADALRARAILQQHRTAEPAHEGGDRQGPIGFACESCHGLITFPGDRRGHVETCPLCGAYVDVPEQQDPTLATPEAAASLAVRSEPAPLTPEAARLLWFEVFAVLCLSVIPALFSAVWSFRFPRGPAHPFAYTETYFVTWMLQLAMPVLIIIKRRQEPWSQFGIVRFSWLGDIGLALATWMGLTWASLAVARLIPPTVLGLLPSIADRAPRPPGIASFMLLVLGSLATGFGEELVMRGYLLSQLERLLKSTWQALMITTLLFASYHCYQGVRGVASTMATGLVMGGMFCMTRRLWPVCLAHALNNFMAGF